MLIFQIDSSKTETTPEGYLKLQAYASRTGVFDYPYQADGYTKQLRSPDQVFKPESMNTLVNKAITLEHPMKDGEPILLDSENTKYYQKGYVLDVYRDGDKLGVNILLTDAELIKQVIAREITMLSAGYQAMILDGSGTYEGIIYNSIQTNIVYNHLAFTNNGRAGKEVRTLLDSKDKSKGILQAIFDSIIDSDNNKKDKESVRMAKLILDSVEYEVSEAVGIAVTGKLKQLNDSLEQVKTNSLSLKGEKEQLEKSIEKLKATQLDSSEIDKKVQEKVKLISEAKQLVSNLNIDSSMSDKDIMESVIKNFDSSFDSKDMDIAELKGNYNAIVRLQKNVNTDSKKSDSKLNFGDVLNKSLNTDSKRADVQKTAYQLMVDSLVGGNK